MASILEELEDLGAETEDTLERFMGDEDMYLKYVRNFPDEPSMGRLEKAMEAKDYAAAEKAVHAMKGVVNNLGFLPLADATVDMLSELRDGNIEAATEAYGDVQDEYRRFCDVIEEWKNS